MKILHTVEFYSPSVGGAQEVVRQLSERMAAMGHDVTVATTALQERKAKVIKGVKIAEFKVSGNEVVGIKGEAKKYQDFLLGSNFDVVMNYAAQQWTTDLTFPILDKIGAKKILVPCGFSGLYNPDYAEYFKKLPPILRKYDATVYLSSNYRDINFARKHKLKNIHLITNAADEVEFNDLADIRNFKARFGIKHYFILTVGSHTGNKGHEEAIEVLKKFPLPATLMIIGNPVNRGCYVYCRTAATEINASSSFPYKKILVLDLPRSETVAAMKSADVLLFLSNIEASPFVLFEAAAAGLPFISTNAGNSEEIARWTGGGLITKTDPDVEVSGQVIARTDPTLKLLLRLRLNPLLRHRLGRQGRSAWQSRFTWERVTKQYLKLYEELLR